MSQTSTYLVRDLTCEHCVTTVTTELSGLAAVTDVAVELAVGGDSRVTVTSSEPLDPRAVRSAVRRAGYRLVR